MRPLIALEGKSASHRFEAEISDDPKRSPHALKYFIRKRRESVESQLAGKSKGDHLSWEDQGLAELLGFVLRIAGAVLFAGMFAMPVSVWALLKKRPLPAIGISACTFACLLVVGLVVAMVVV